MCIVCHFSCQSFKLRSVYAEKRSNLKNYIKPDVTLRLYVVDDAQLLPHLVLTQHL